MKHLRLAGIGLLLALCCLIVTGQSTPTLVNIFKPSPSAQAMQKYGDIPVSSYTGIPSISIPIYTLQFRDITFPVTLSYHASGIKVAEEASEVGLGWVLNAGASISRNIIGDDDFSGTSYLTGSMPDLDSGMAPQNKVQQGCILSLINQKYANLPTLYTDTLTSVLGGGYPVDWQPDQFYFNIPGKSGKFILRHNGQVLLQNQEKLEISYTTGGASWQIKDEKGNTYDFTQFETYQSSAGSPVQHKSAWYLTQLTSPTGNKITFNYTPLPANFVVPTGSLYERKDAVQLPAVDAAGNVFNAASLGYQYGTTPASTYYQEVLSSIDFTNGLVKFNYSGNRTDLTGDVRLDSVSVYSKDAGGTISPSPIRTFALFYGYFFGEQYCYIGGTPSFNTQPGPTTTRLRLDSVRNTGYYNGHTVTEKPYRFNYIQTAPALQPSKLSLARDHWGFYNGKTNNISLIPSVNPINSMDYIQTMVGVPGTERDTDTTGARLFSLSSIVYPTGGSTEFQLESNDYDLELSEVNDHAIFSRLESASSQVSSTGYDGINHRMYSDSVIDLSNEYFRPADGTAGSGTTVSITVTVRMASASGTLNQLNTTDLIYFSLIDPSGHTVLSKDLGNLGICDANTSLACLVNNQGVYSYTYTNLYLPPDKYTVRAYVSTIFGTTVEDFLINLNWLSNTSGSLVADLGQGSRNYGFAGGLRARRIIDHDGINPAHDHIRHYVYHYTANKGTGAAEYSFGRRMSRPQYFYFEWVGSSFSSNEEGLSRIYTGYNNHLFRSADSNYPLNGSAEGSPVGYDQVTVLDGESGEYGKSVYSYYNQPDLVYDFTYYDQLPHRPPANSSVSYQLNGSLLHEVSYANVGGVFYKKKEATNVYNNFPTRQNVLYGVENRGAIGDGTYNPTYNCTNILLFYPSLISQWNCLLEQDEKTYTSLTDTVTYLENHTLYSYDNSAHFLPTRAVTYNSKGDTITTFTRYPLDYVSSASTSTSGDAFNNGIIRLNASHMIDAPIEIYQQHKPFNGSAAFVTKGQLTAYSPTLPKPSLCYDLELSAPEAGYTAAAISNGATTMDANYVNYVAVDEYDPNGNILQQRKVNDLKRSYVYDYNNSFPIAEVVNSAVADIAYTSFESNGYGGWTIGTGNVGTTGGITGRNFYTLSSGANIYKSGLTTNTRYLVTYWAKNGPLTIPGTTLRSGLVKRGWTFYQHSLPAGSSSISISGAGVTLDELRLYPADAQMSTHTYDPLAGITSAANQAGIVTYFEYDGLGRLQRIRDMDSNIVKQYDYEYQQQQVYVNAVQSGPFTPVCGTGGTSVPVVYTISAGMFTSTISQGDADQKARDYLAENGPAYANAHNSCIYYNTVQQGSFSRGNCAPGAVPSTVTYTIAAGAYSSTVDQPTANVLAATALAANGPAYANATGSCTFYNTTRTGVYFKTCGTGGESAGYATTVNGGTYASLISQQNADSMAISYLNAVGQSNADAHGSCTYYNTIQIGSFTWTCPCVYIGSAVADTIAAGVYTSPNSLTEANQLAAAALAADGPNHATAYGTCTTRCTGPSHKIINCVCQTGALKVVSQTQSGSGVALKCTTQYGYFFSDGTYLLGDTTVTAGQCPQQ